MKACTLASVRVLATLVLLSLGSGLSGCGKSPERVCDKFGSLMKDAKDMPKSAGDRDACVKQMNDMKARDEKGYDCTADCVLGAGDARGAISCMSKCSAPAK